MFLHYNSSMKDFQPNFVIKDTIFAATTACIRVERGIYGADRYLTLQ